MLPTRGSTTSTVTVRVSGAKVRGHRTALGVGIWGLGFWVLGIGFRVWGLGSRV